MSKWKITLSPVASGLCPQPFADMARSLRRVLDAEAARVVQPATVTPTASSTSTTQPQGFRADLWRRIQQLRQRASADILTRWTVYQELKPLYDLVDGAQGEAAMPRDVAEALQAPEHTNDLVVYGRDNAGRVCLHLRDGDNRTYSAIARTARTNNTSPIILNERLHDFATVLDTVAEQRVAERQATAAEPTPSVSPLREQQAPQPAAPEPRSFADVRPDRHGTQWDTLRSPRRLWAGWNPSDLVDALPAYGVALLVGRNDGASCPDETARILQTASSIAQQASQQILGSTVTVPPTTGHVETPLPRFTADELDDVDHSATTTQDSAILKRGKLPTVEALGKYREVMARRNGTVAEAVKASGIDCEVAQYVLERWAGGLSDSETEIICDEAHGAASFTRADIDKRLSRWFAIIRPTLDTSEPADTAAQRQRAEAAERKARMAALQAQLAKERAARIVEPQEEPTRFSLLEVDEAADPSKSIEAWKAQRAANERRARNTVRPVTVTSPPPAPKRKPFEVVDAQADGLSGGAAFAVLLSRAMNQNC